MCFFVIIFPSIIYFLEFFTIFHKNYFIMLIIETISYLFFIINYFLAILINSGIIDRKYYSNNIKLNNNNNIDYNKCYICNVIYPKSLKIYHCKICNICIIEYDHHCPWTGKCIGKYNIIEFNFFIIGLFCFILSTIASFIIFIVNFDKR